MPGEDFHLPGWLAFRRTTPRVAGGLVSGAASKAVVPLI